MPNGECFVNRDSAFIQLACSGFWQRAPRFVVITEDRLAFIANRIGLQAALNSQSFENLIQYKFPPHAGVTEGNTNGVSHRKNFLTHVHRVIIFSGPVASLLPASSRFFDNLRPEPERTSLFESRVAQRRSSRGFCFQ